jgi:dTDP-glucose 4,6-dehydratase
MVRIARLNATGSQRHRPILVTGGAGFIGANFIRAWLDAEKAPVVNLDKLTYAGNCAA